MTEADAMRRALALARRGEGHTRPNPPVGAVIVRDGAVIGEGWHRRCGEAHAEAAALADARTRGEDPRGADLFVTLEPCSKPGRVGACTDAIRTAGLARVAYAVPDPNPANAGRAASALAEAGIACTCWADAAFADDDPRADAVRDARRLIAPFAHHIRTGRPFVTVKLAMSLDGRICDDRGDARWISSAASRARTGALRERVDAVLVGAETVRRDNPSLLSHGEPNDDLIRAVVSRSGSLPSDAQVFTDGRNRTLVFDDALKALDELGRLGCLHVLCEGGLRLATALAEAGRVNDWITVLAPKVIGARPIADATVLPGADVFATFSELP